MMRLKLSTADDVLLELRDRFKKVRLERDLSQAGLAERSGVNIHTLRRFETTGKISLEGLLKLAFVLDLLKDFDRVGLDKSREYSSKSLDQVLAIRARTRTRARRK